MAKLYTISEQHHEKKGIYIYVVRLIKKVDKDVFTILREYANNYDGYYSSYRGVNGFVFQSEEDAEAFGSILDSYFEDSKKAEKVKKEEPEEVEVPQKTRIRRPRIKKVSEESQLQSESIDINSGMPMHLALRRIIETEGEDIIKELRLVNILDDFNAYDSIPASKYILRAMITEGISSKLLSYREWNNKVDKLITKFISTTGFVTENVNAIFNAMAFGLQWTEDLNNSSVPLESAQSTLKDEEVSTNKESNGDIFSILRETYLVFKSYNKYGIMNCLGEVTLSADYDRLYKEYSTDSIVYTKLNNLYGIYNVESKTNVTPKYEEIKSFQCNMTVVKKSGLYGYIDENGCELIPCQFDEADDFWEERAIVSKKKRGKKKFVIDTKGKTIVPPIYTEIGFFTHGRAAVRIDNGLTGFIDLNGKLVLPFNYSDVNYPLFLFGHCLVHEYYKEYDSIIDTSGNVILRLYSKDYNWMLLNVFENKGLKHFILSRYDYDTEQRSEGVMDFDGNVIIPFAYSDISESFDVYKQDFNYLRVKICNLYGCISCDGEILIDIISEESTDITNGYAIIKQKGRYGVMKIGSEWVLPCIYKSISILEPSKDGTDKFIVSKGKKWGVISNKQEWIIPCQFDSVVSGLDSQFIVSVKNKQKVIDSNLNEIIGARFISISTILDTKCYLCFGNNKAEVIDSSGILIKSFSCDEVIALLDDYYFSLDNECEDTESETYE